MIGRGLTEENTHWQFLRLLARQVPDKSAKECGRCLQRVEAKRIAYFGPRTRSTSTSPLRASRSPLHSTATCSHTGSNATAEPPQLPPPMRTGSACRAE